MNKESKVLYTQYITESKKEGNHAICDSMDGPREHYAKWNKSAGKR